MNHAIYLTVVLWIWVVSAPLAFAFLIYLWVSEVGESDHLAKAAIVWFLSVICGLLFCAFQLLGFPIIALWVWRILSGVAVIGALFPAAQALAGKPVESRAISPTSSIQKQPSIVGRILILATACMTIGVFACSLYSTSAISAPTTLPSPTHLVEDSIERLDFWHAASLGIMGCGTLLFTLLLVGALQRQGLLWFESSSISLGSGIGGWRMSSSIVYLAIAVLFAAMFSALIMHDETNLKTPATSTAGQAAATSQPSNSTNVALPQSGTNAANQGPTPPGPVGRPASQTHVEQPASGEKAANADHNSR